MGRNSHIEWTHHTFNPWWGCVKVSPACKNCYAELWAKRLGEDVWGGRAPRRFFTDEHWREPLRWNKAAAAERTRKRVFCASMADVFEARSELDPHRDRLWKLIESTPWLDWLLLTKRPQQIGRLVPWGEAWPENVWIGATVENQTWAEKRMDHLLQHPARARFLSCEPLLGQVNLELWLSKPELYGLDWVIAGGESGQKARPMNPYWLRDLRDQCTSHSVAFHFKQWGHWIPEDQVEHPVGRKQVLLDPEGNETCMVAMGKKAAGRLFEGTTWDQVPALAL